MKTTEKKQSLSLILLKYIYRSKNMESPCFCPVNTFEEYEAKLLLILSIAMSLKKALSHIMQTKASTEFK